MCFTLLICAYKNGFVREVVSGVVISIDFPDEKTFSPVNQVRTFINSVGTKICIYPAPVNTYSLYRILKLCVPLNGFVAR
jgi:hypothetical protein